MIPRIALLIIAGTLVAHGQVLKTQDISPDASDYIFANAGDPGGRVNSLVIDPNHNDVLYAASEFAGVWKSTSGVKSKLNKSLQSVPTVEWFHSSKGLRNGMTVNQYSLAVDQANSNRLLYASGDNDGRPPTAAGAHPLGGLWVSLDAAGNWRHEKLCPARNDGTTYDDGVTAVVFSTGRPFVATTCGIWTNDSDTLDSSSWTSLKGGPSGAGTFLADGGAKTLFACLGGQVFRTPDLGTKWEQMTITGNCLALTAVPGSTSSSDHALVVQLAPCVKGPCAKTNKGSQEVTVLDFTTRKTQNLGFNSVAINTGSGVSAVAAPPILHVPLGPPVAGFTYDVYAADGFNWFKYSLTIPHWTTLSMHVDTWAMAVPSRYNPLKGDCSAFASTDGGVFFNQGRPLTQGGCAAGTWAPVQNGLHALEATQIGVITAGSRPYMAGDLPLTIYMPTGDNDVFVTDVAVCPSSGSLPCQFNNFLWQNTKDGLGDAGQVLVDPAFPKQALFSRNNTYEALIGTTYTGMIPSLNGGATFDNGGQSVGTYDLTQVMTTPGELSTGVSSADYLAVKDFDPSTCSANQTDHVLRNRSNPPSASSWADLSPIDHFLSCDIKKVQAGGGHSAGLTAYVLTTRNLKTPKASFDKGRGPGQIYRGVVSGQGGGTPIQQWAPASGSKEKPLGEADNFYVNPFDPKELYAVDVRDQDIKVSRDSGATWDTESTLTDIATNHGEYEIGCNGSRGQSNQSDPFANACSIAWIAFDVFHPNVRVASAGYGGIAFSRDDGHHWMALDVTDNNHLVSDNLTELVAGVFYDGESRLPDLAASDQVIYAGLKGHSLIRVEGPFQTLEALNFVYKPTSSANKVSVEVTPLGVTVDLRKDPDGSFRGSILFDSDVHKSVLYFLKVDGTLVTTKDYTLTSADIANGVATAH